MKIEIRSWKSDIVLFSTMEAADMAGALQQACRAGVMLTGADLAGVNLAGVALAGARLHSAKLAGALLSDAYLARADLTNADLSGADLTSAILHGAHLGSADLSSAKMRGADLTGASFPDANLFGADLRIAELSLADLYGAHFGGLDIPLVEYLDSKVLNAIRNHGLDMEAWHTCDSIHCRGGWIIHLAGPDGYRLEQAVGSNTAAALIYARSTGRKVPNFYDSHESTLADIRRSAMLESIPVELGIGGGIDPLAVMLDGVAIEARGATFRLGGAFSVENLRHDPGLAAMVQLSSSHVLADVAEAILELEGVAGSRISFGGGVCFSKLAGAAFRKAGGRERFSRPEAMAKACLEGAALLRDGWRPRGWKKWKR